MKKYIIFLLISANAYSLTIEEAIQKVSSNENVLIAAEKVKEVKNNEKALVGNILPDISLNGSYNKYGDGETIKGYDAHSVSLQLLQPLFNGMKEFNALSAAKLLSEAEVLLHETVLRETKQRLINSIFTYLKTKKELEINRDLLKISNERVVEIEKRARIGKSKKSDVYSAKAQAFNVEGTIKEIENNLEVSRLEISRIINLGKEEIKDVKNDIGFDDNYDVSNYPSLKALKILKEVVEKQISIAKGDHSPSVNLRANYYLENSNINSERDWDAGVTLNFPLYQGGSVDASVTNQYINLRKSEIEIVRAQKMLNQMFETLAVEINTGKERLVLNEKSKKANKLNYEEAKKEYGLGLITNLDVIAAMNQYIESEKIYARTFYNVLSSKYQFKVLSEK